MAAVAASWVGQVLGGRYRVTAKLGEGGMAFVYRAHDLRMEADVVVKAPRPALLDDPEFADRFRREVRALVRLAHPHIARVSDVGDHGGIPFAVLDYLAGGSLQDRRIGADGRPAPQPAESLRGWLADVAAALGFIHAAHHVHRDVKPDNILFDAHGRVYLSDFGVVKTLEGAGVKGRQTVLTGAGMVLGTPRYMAPELILGERYDGRADQYALAVTVHELLGGAPPFDGATPVALLMERMNREAPSLREAVPGLPKGLAAAVRKGLARDPGDRHADCGAFARAVLGTMRGTAERAAAPAGLAKKDTLPVATPAATCPACGKLLGLPAKMWGKKVKCPACTKTFQAPMPGVETTTGGVAQWAETRSARQALVDTAKMSAVRRRNRKRLLIAGVAAGAFVVVAFYLLVGWMVMAGGRGSGPEKKPAPTTPLLQAALPPALPPDAPFVPPPPEAAAKEITNSIGMKLALIPAGEFTMGSPEGEAERGSDETAHAVEISQPFYLGVTTVTQAEYQKVVGDNPSYFSAGGGGKDKVAGLDTTRFPVEEVSWDDAVAFCAMLSGLEVEQQGGRTYRLPTEAEWEYACRAGTRTPFSFGDRASSKDANFDGNYPYGGAEKGSYLGRPAPVGSYSKNAFGLYDMHGNVWQWCGDWYDKDYYKNSPNKDPQSKNIGTLRALRGGSWGSNGRSCRAAFRNWYDPGDRLINVGFRVVCVARRTL